MFVVVWQIAAAMARGTLMPGPVAVARAIGELAAHGLLFRYLIASLFRVTWGYVLAQ